MFLGGDQVSAGPALGVRTPEDQRSSYSWGGRLGPGNRNEVGVCVSVASMNQVSTRGDHHSWVRWAHQSPEWGPGQGTPAGPCGSSTHVAGLQRSGWGPLSTGVGPFQCFHGELWYT